MKIRIRYFASLREALGSEEHLEVTEGSTVAQVRLLLAGLDERHAVALAPGRALRCALNELLCDGSAQVGEGADVAFFPPVTGG